MKTKARITERYINAALTFIVLVIMSVYSCICSAQDHSTDPNFPGVRIKPAGASVNVAAHVNENAKAVAMRSSINSAYPELKPALAPQGDKLYFSRVAHPNNTNGVADMEDIWYSNYDAATNAWSEPIRMPGYLNNAGPNFIENVSQTGDTVILGNTYMKNGKMKNGVSYSVNINGTWTFPKQIIIQDDYNISEHGNHFVSLKLGVIISAVQRVETEGHRDLYVSFWNGEYATEPVNMGAVINSDMEESSPYLASDDKTLYFASKGHNGYGGYDIFMTTRLDETWTNWSTPVNLGPAVNDRLDEEFFSITHCGKFAVFTKNTNVHNEDLFKVSLEDLFGTPGLVPSQETVVSNPDARLVKETEVKGPNKSVKHTFAPIASL